MPDNAPIPDPAHARAVFCNRTLNMRSIQAIGFDMDYTLIHYDEPEWEARAYAHVQRRLLDRGLPVAALRFDAALFTRGLILDLQLGNIVKANRFGYVTKAAHGTQLLPHDQQREVYSQVWIDLRDARWVFLNTLFSLSEACLYAQLVELRDQGSLASELDYAAIHGIVLEAMNAAHLEGELKAEIIADPQRFVVLDPDLPRTLLDMVQAGKRLFLATNSEWEYAQPMMSYAFDRFLPGGDWRDLFELVIVQAGKPGFFDSTAPFAEVGAGGKAARSIEALERGRCYRGGNAQLVQDHLGLAGAEILYVGDHVYADIHVSSQIRRWRTALVLRELEDEVAQEQAFAGQQRELEAAMRRKEQLDREQALLRLALLRLEHGGPLPDGIRGDAGSFHERLRELRQLGEALEMQIAPLAVRAGELGNARWGPLMRAGNDKSRLARQIERHADIYTSRVSNLLQVTPFGYLRAARGSLPHDVR